jgi:threonine dehydratase
MSMSCRNVEEAATRIRPYVHETPVVTSAQINEIAGCEPFLKCENLQKAGAFKTRGAVNAVFSLDQSVLAVATHSSGNHGAALARAAQLKGVAAHIVVPDNAKQVKVDAIRHYGGNVIKCEPTLAAREDMLALVVTETGATIVHPYDDDKIIAGQGTAALEFTSQVPGLDALVTPVGGGGLLAGSALVTSERGLSIFGAEPEGADDAYRSFHSGHLVVEHVPDTICDGLLTTLGERNFEIIRSKVEDILLVNEAEIVDAMRLLWTRTKQVIEPSSAVTLAAVLRNSERFTNSKIGLIITGGNVDLGDLPF